ncbi:hypothetical protein M2284_002659 [Rhodococcus sp. LBL1]|nr:hypothetical protein [Rhodococcus sp. LBL1]MDH6684043.1 hypothetical protein [Rhodococcus sp. LBL2]
MAASTDLVDALGDYRDVLTDANLAQFLATHNWTCQSDRKFDQVWVQPGIAGERVAIVRLPREPSFVDYSKRLHEAVGTIATVYDWRLSQLAEQVASIRADLFFIRLDQHSKDGTIPLRQASSLLDSIDVMIRSAAVTAYNPNSSGRGRIPEQVSNFLNDDLRMGHTKKGSFIITVAARLDDAGEHSAAKGARASTDSDGQPIPSFGRQVMTTLARSLEATRRYATKQADNAIDLDSAVEQGMRLPMVQALQGMSEGEGLRSLDLSFEWASTEPQRATVPTQVVLDRAVIDELPTVEVRLTKSVKPERITIVGPVTELKRSEQDDAEEGEDAGEIVIRADVNGRLRRIVVPLSGTSYDWAIRAHRDRLPFTVTGELARKSNVWRLNEPIETDISFLEHKLGPKP